MIKGDPQQLPPCVNRTPHHWQFGVAANHNVYFRSHRSQPGTAGIYCSRCVDGAYQEPAPLDIDGEAPFVTPDESCLLFIRLMGGDAHLHVSFAQADGRWSEPIDLAETVHPQLRGMCPYITPDERYLFIIQRGTNHNISWRDAGFLRELRETRAAG